MRNLLLASAAIVGFACSTFASNAFAASGADNALPTAAEIQRIQERQSVLLEAHLAGMEAGLKLNAEQAKNWPAFESAIRDAAKARARIGGPRRASAWLKANVLRQSRA